MPYVLRSSSFAAFADLSRPFRSATATNGEMAADEDGGEEEEEEEEESDDVRPLPLYENLQR